jgi:hypothetical protein
MPALRPQFYMLLSAVCLCQLAVADEPREYVDDKGNKVREYRDVVKRQVWETQMTEQQQTILKPEIKTEYQTQVRQYQVPITETVLVPELVNRWNPFATPHYEYKQVQRTRYELKQETVQIPITRQHWVQAQDTVKVPKLVQREHEEEIIRRVVVRDLPAAATANTQLAKLPPATAPAARTAAIPTIRANPTAPAALPPAANPLPSVAVQRDPFAAPAPSTNFQQPAPSSFQPNNNNPSMARRATSPTIPPPTTAPSAMLPPAGMPNVPAPSGYANPPARLPTNPTPPASMYNMPTGNPSPASSVPGRYQ